MPFYTYDEFVDLVASYTHNSETPRNELYDILLEDEKLPEAPNFVVDHIDRQLHDARHIYEPLEAYAHLNFEGKVYMAPDRDTAYFELKDDALLFMLAA